MKLENVSNYPQILEGERIETGETVELSLDAATMQKIRGSDKFDVKEEDDSASDSDVEETSKPKENQEEGEN